MEYKHQDITTVGQLKDFLATIPNSTRLVTQEGDGEWQEVTLIRWYPAFPVPWGDTLPAVLEVSGGQPVTEEWEHDVRAYGLTE